MKHHRIKDIAMPCNKTPDLHELRLRELQAPRYTSYPTARELQDGFDPKKFEDELMATNDELVPVPLSFYVHLPYCAAACFYCGCHRLISRSAKRQNAYLESLLREIEHTSSLVDNDRPIQQIHFGGGTPNLLRPAELRRIIQALTKRNKLAPNHETSIEVDPRQHLLGDACAWAQIGFNRISIGVQDVDPDVQTAINRIQPSEKVEEVVAEARSAGIQSINFDLVLGLPKQSTSSIARTLDWLKGVRPERVALYQYAHMPSRFPAQRAIHDDDLPSTEERFAMQAEAKKQLRDAGYIDIGLDHYALPNDDLARALKDGRLRRNFQGYTVLGESDLLGFGVSSISEAGRCMAQNTTELESYRQRVDNQQSAIQRGFVRDNEDSIRARIINELMCTRKVDTAAIARDENLHFAEHFADAIQKLNELDPHQLFLNRSHAIWTVSEEGNNVLRLLALCFDTHTASAATKADVLVQNHP